MTLSIRAARRDEAALVLSFVRELAEYEKLSHEVDATEAMIADALFGASPSIFCDLAEWQGEPVGFALWFNTFSSFRGRRASGSKTFSCGRRIVDAGSGKRS